MENNLFFIYSIYAIAYLKSKGFKEVKISKDNVGRVVYYFEDTEDLQKALLEYRQNWELNRFIKCYKQTKNEIMELKNKD